MRTTSVILSIACLFAALLAGSCGRNNDYIKLSGTTEGTFYNITYRGALNYQDEIEQLLQSFDNSLSVYNPSSLISKLNRNEEAPLDSFFITCFLLSQQISLQTQGAFDISASPLFNAWGFGPDKRKQTPSQSTLDSLKRFCGMDKVRLQAGVLQKADPRLQLNCNAVAKGYSVDVVAQFLLAKNIEDFLVEIGGEIFCRGTNKQGQPWSVGIDCPQDGNYTPGAQLQTVIEISGKGLATSGNYRRFFEKDGVKYAHTIDPHTGYPAQHNLLSATVIAATCGEADAYATALMVMGLEGAKLFLEQHPELEAYLIFAATEDFETYATTGFARMIKE